MLYHGLSATERTLGLLADPVADASPAEDVAALRRGGVLELLETERALALLRALDPAHGVLVREVVAHAIAVRGAGSRDRGRRRVRHGSDVDPRRLGGARARPAHLRKQDRVVGAVRVLGQRDVHTPCSPGSDPCSSGARIPLTRGERRGRGERLESGADVQVGLHAHLDDEEHAEQLVPGAVGGRLARLRLGLRARREDVPEAREALRELVVRPGEVEEREAEGVHGGRGREGRQVREEVRLELVGPGLRWRPAPALQIAGLCVRGVRMRMRM